MTQKRIKKESEQTIMLCLNTTTNMSSSSLSFCEICKIKLVEHRHHKDKNHKNNKPENIQGVCTLCHAKIHGIEPRFSALRRLVVLYTRTQKARIALTNQIRGFSNIELVVPKTMQIALHAFEEDEKNIDKQIKHLLESPKKKGRKKKTEEVDQVDVVINDLGKNVEPSVIMNKGDIDQPRAVNDNQNSCVELAKDGNDDQVDHRCPEYHSNNVEQSSFPIYSWLKSQKGIGHLLAAKLIAYIDINLTPSQSALRQYAGWGDPMDKKRKGYKTKHNPTLKTFFYQLAESFIKQGKDHSYIKDYYRPYKAKQLWLMRMAKRGDKIDNAPKTKGHAHNRAMRFMIKKFINDLYKQMKYVSLDQVKPEHHVASVETLI